MFGTAREIYVSTRKKQDQLWNLYVMRPIASLVVVVFAKTSITPNQVTLLNLFVLLVAAVLLVALPTWKGALVAIGVLETSYCLDCVDGMLARYKKIASKEGHLFDFFTDEIKAVVLVAALAVRLWRTGGFGLDGTEWPAADARFLLAGIAGTGILASAISLTNFVRRPELSGQATTVESHYDRVEDKPKSAVARLGGLVNTFLRFLNHYPSHIWIFALLDRLDALFWMWVSLNLLYLGRGWLGLLLRFGRPPRAT
jgi:hypothetical protein